MKYFIFAVAFVIAGYFAYHEMVPPPPPPPPPPVPSVPPPVINPRDFARILKSADDPEPTVRWQAYLFLDNIWFVKEAQQAILSHFHSDTSAKIRARMADEILSHHSGPLVSQNLVWALRDPEAEVRLSALKALSKLGDLATAPNVARVAQNDVEGEVRAQALATLNVLQKIENDKIREEQEAAEQAAEAARQQRQNRWLSF